MITRFANYLFMALLLAVCLPMTTMAQVTVELDTGHQLHLVDLNNSPRTPALTVSNPLAQDVSVTLALSAESYLGKTQTVEKTLKIQAKNQVSLPLSWVDLKQQDHWWLNYTLTDNATGKQTTGRRILSIIKTNGKTPVYHAKDRFLFGMNTHSVRFDDATVALEAYATGLIGLDITRSSSTWGRLQPDADTWDPSSMNRMIDAFKQYNVEIFGMAGFTPKWASTGDTNNKDWLVWSRAAPKMDAWANYIRKLGESFGSDIRYWEMWNEPDLSFFRGTTEEYIQMCKVAYPIFKKVTPDVTVLSGGWSRSDRNPAMIQQVLAHAGDTFDVLAIHEHGPFTTFSDHMMTAWGPWREQYIPGKQAFFTETGMVSLGDTRKGDQRQAVELVRKISYAMSQNAIAYLWYELRDGGDDPMSHEQRYGMITRDYYPKMAYHAYNTLVNVLRGYHYVSTYDLSENQWLLLFEKDGQYLLVGWAQHPSAQGQVFLTSDAKSVTQVDLLGNRTSLSQLTGGVAAVTLRAEPAYWLFESTTAKPQIGDSVIKLAGVQAWVPGQANKVVFDFTNTLGEATDYIFSVQLPKSLGGKTIQQRQPIAAKTTMTITIPVGVLDVASRFGVPLPCSVDYQEMNGRVVGTSQFSIQWAGLIARGDFDDVPTFTLDQRDQVSELFVGDPHNTHRLWKGVDDLSANVWLSASDTALNVRVMVRDDKHVQEQKVTQLWRSDCIQLAMQLSGQKGMWEINFAADQSGKPQLHPGIVPQGINVQQVAGQFQLTATPRAGGWVYDLTLPFEGLGITRKTLMQGINLSLLVNDDDGLGRDGWITLSRGIADGKDPSFYPLFVAP